MQKTKTPTAQNHTPVYLQHYNYIDALRGLAIIGVLLAHVSEYSNITYPSWLQVITAVDVGPRGVQLFYVVSAFTLCLSFSKRKNSENHPLRNFYIRRFFRIAPLFYLAVAYYLLQQEFLYRVPIHFSALNIITTLTFTNGISSAWINNIVFGGWSIAIEAAFYLLFPLLFYALKNFRFAIIATFITAIIVQTLRLFLLTLPPVQQNPDLQFYLFMFFPSQLPVFLIGMVSFFYFHEKISLKKQRQIQLLLACLGILLLAQQITHFKIIAGHYIYGLFFTMLLLGLSKFPSKLLVNSFMVNVGKISFSLYLCHMAVYYWLTQFGLDHFLPTDPYLNFALRFIILFGLSSIVATILFLVVEKNGITLGKKLINKYEKVTPSYITSNARTW